MRRWKRGRFWHCANDVVLRMRVQRRMTSSIATSLSRIQTRFYRKRHVLCQRPATLHKWRSQDFAIEEGAHRQAKGLKGTSCQEPSPLRHSFSSVIVIQHTPPPRIEVRILPVSSPVATPMLCVYKHMHDVINHRQHSSYEKLLLWEIFWSVKWAYSCYGDRWQLFSKLSENIFFWHQNVTGPPSPGHRCPLPSTHINPPQLETFLNILLKLHN